MSIDEQAGYIDYSLYVHSIWILSHKYSAVKINEGGTLYESNVSK